MEGQGIVIIIHFNVALIFADSFPDAFYAEAMSAPVRFTGGKAALGTGKRILSAGINDGYHDKRGIGSSGCIYFNKSFRNIAGGFYGIVQQVAKQGSEVAVCNKISCPMPDIHMKRNMLIVALAFVLAQNGIEHFMDQNVLVILIDSKHEQISHQQKNSVQGNDCGESRGKRAGKADRLL